MKALEFLKGKKTYIVAAGFVAYELLGLYLEGKPINVQVIATALIGATVRAGLANTAKQAEQDKKEVKQEIRDNSPG